MKRKTRREEWFYEDGLTDYLRAATDGYATLPAEPFTGSFSSDSEAVDWALQWLPEGGELVTESYVNLIPTSQGGTHVNGLRTGLTRRDARILRAAQPAAAGRQADPGGRLGALQLRAVVKLEDPQFSGQTKERLSRPARPRRSSPAWPRTRSACG
jgi:topoisomerase-4 subunit B